MIVNHKVNEYIEELISIRDPLLTSLEEEAKTEHIPIIQLASIQFIHTLLSSIQPQKILEVGTAIGYSTIWLARAVPKASITTMEINEQRFERASQNFIEAGIADRVDLIFGDAGEGLPNQVGFDFIFLDAAKGQYKKYVDVYFPLLNVGGIIICDNTLFKGQVTLEHIEERRWVSMVTKLREFNQFMMEHPHLETSIIPIGDGLTFSVKKGE